ncbi:MAG: DUF4271 domain-containing protein [Prevotellaceae bacterium]|jgi:hypothetical protein|nr:DUF4271 domain-containing protein [Prevotellaceae bacterium]
MEYSMITDPATLTGDSPATEEAAVFPEDSSAIGNTAPEAVYGSCSVLEAPAKKTAEPVFKDTPPGLFEGFLSLGVIFLFLLLFCYVRRFFSTLMSSLFNFHTAEKQFAENSLSVIMTSRALLVFSFISIGFFAWLILLRAGVIAADNGLQWKYFGILIVALAAFFMLKAALLRLVEFISKNAPLMQLIIFFSRLHCIACGFLLFPIALLIVTAGTETFFHGLSVAGFGVVLFFIMLYILRIIRIFFMAHISTFFLILYLCTFEVAPFLLLYSFIISDQI